MHGKLKSEQKELTDEELSYIRKARELFKKCIYSINEDKKKNIYSLDTLQQTEKLLKINTEISILWNYRRDYILNEYNNNNHNINFILNEELIFIENLFKSDIKSYNLWSSRMWIIEFIINLKEIDGDLIYIENNYLKNFDVENSNLNIIKNLSIKFNNIKMKILLNELLLCNKLFNIDSRNFHCWKYHSFILTCIKYISNNISCNDFEYQINNYQLDFLNNLINNDFSNYSAWYQKTLLNNSLEINDIQDISNEIELIHTAFYTEPNDQSIWQYYFWLIKSFIPKILFNDDSNIIDPSFYIKKFLIQNLNDIFHINIEFSISCEVNNDNSELYISDCDNKILIHGNWMPIYNDKNISQFQNKLLPNNFRNSIKKRTSLWKFIINSSNIDNYIKLFDNNLSHFIICLSLTHSDLIYTEKPLWESDQYIFNQSKFSSLNINPKINLNQFHNYRFLIYNSSNKFFCKYNYNSNLKLKVVKWKEILINEFDVIKNIQELEPECKYPILALKLIYDIYHLCIPFDISEKNEIKFDHNILERLQVIDPIRKYYYINKFQNNQ